MAFLPLIHHISFNTAGTVYENDQRPKWHFCPSSIISASLRQKKQIHILLSFRDSSYQLGFFEKIRSCSPFRIPPISFIALKKNHLLLSFWDSSYQLHCFEKKADLPIFCVRVFLPLLLPSLAIQFISSS